MVCKRLCAVEDVEPGSMTEVSVDGTEFLVLRGEEGGFLVTPSSCPHMNASLCEGFFDGTLLTCSKHLWQWSVKDGSMQGIAEAPLLVYDSSQRDGELYVQFENELHYSYQD